MREGRKGSQNNLSSEPHSPYFLFQPTSKSSSFHYYVLKVSNSLTRVSRWLGRDILVVCLTSLCILVKLSVLNRRRKLKYNELFKTCLIVFIGHKSREQRHRDRPYALPPPVPLSQNILCAPRILNIPVTYSGLQN